MSNEFTLSDYLSAKNLKPKTFADMIGVSRQEVFNWMERRATPSLRNYIKMERVRGFNVKPIDLLSKKELIKYLGGK